MQTAQYPHHVQAIIDAVFTQGADSSSELRHAVLTYASTAGSMAQPTLALPDEWQSYLDKVIHQAYRITDQEPTQLQEQGHSEEEIFELTIMAALGAGLARLEHGLAAMEKVKGAL